MKKRRIVIILSLILLAAAYSFFVLRSESDVDTGKTADIIANTCPRYKIDVDFDPEAKKLTAFQEVAIVNSKAEEFESLYFHIYPNAFKNADKVPFADEDISYAYPEGFAPGYINIKKVTAGTREVEFNIEDTILEIKLETALKPKEEISLTFEFEVQIPPAIGNFGYGENTYNIAQWYPILAVYDEKGWHKDPYYGIGDPFYSEVAQYEVKIKAPKEYTIAASGSLDEKHEENGRVAWSFKTGLIRDFAWSASASFETREATVGKSKVISYYIKGKEEYGQKALEFGKNALSFFNEYFGEYPYENYSIVAADFIFSGMEYPNLVIVNEEFYEQGMYLDYLEYTIVHETAHQWWYGLVGNNQIEEAWLDEALTEYSTVLYYEHYYGKAVAQDIYERFTLAPYRYFETSMSLGPIKRLLSEFENWDDYSATVYNRGAIMLKDIEARMGKEKLREALKFYFEQNIYDNATAEDFISALNRVTGTDWTDYVNEWLETTEILESAA